MVQIINPQLLRLHPDSPERIATLEVEDEYDQQWRSIQREQNAQIIATYRNAQESPEVCNAIENLAKKAVLKRATQIVGAIGESVDELHEDLREAVGDRSEDPSAAANEARRLASRIQTEANRPRPIWRGGVQIEPPAGDNRGN